jgi:transcriptional regulator with XRE-family HTH domain
MGNQIFKTAEVFGVNLCIQRKNRGLTQLQLSKDIGVHESTISNWESGLREPNLNTVIMISKYFDVSIDYLLGNKVTIPEHYIIVNEAFPGCIDYLYSVAMNLNIQQREKLIKLIKRFVILQRKGEQL